VTATFSAALAADIAKSAELLRGRRIALLTGAGISTDSGIPAYRGAGARTRADPMTGARYLADEAARRRYWIGGHLGWRAFGSATPNTGHIALAEMERAGAVMGVITQNVDGLHLRAGSSRVVEMHGTMRRVLCLRCGQVFDRRDIAAQIEELNPWITVPENVVLNPDGDAAPESVDGFTVPSCTVCGGMRGSDALIVAGSSLVVNSGVRIVERARRRSIPLIIINREPTRADTWADIVLTGGTGDVLPALKEQLT
jgi:NAD-dependent SIR2 family protein deacetylase